MTTTARIRGMIGDKTAPYNLTDGEIDAFYSEAGTIYGAAALALRAIIAQKGMSGKRVSAGDYSEDASAFIKILSDMADRFEQMDQNTPAEAQAEVVVNDFNYRNILENKVMRGESLTD